MHDSIRRSPLIVLIVALALAVAALEPVEAQAINHLVRAGFADRGGKGSHRNFLHPSGVRVTVSGRLGDDAKGYQEREVAQQMAAARAARRGRK